jgi:hypothetical protein
LLAYAKTLFVRSPCSSRIDRLLISFPSQVRNGIATDASECTRTYEHAHVSISYATRRGRARRSATLRGESEESIGERNTRKKAMVQLLFLSAGKKRRNRKRETAQCHFCLFSFVVEINTCKRPEAFTNHHFIFCKIKRALRE